MKITAISLCGTYPSWTAYAIGSVYNVVDEIIVVNSGYNIDQPELGCKFPEKYNQEQLSKFPDIDNKLLIFDGLDHNSLDERYRIDYTINEFGRAGNATFANRLARERDADWILHVASDQVFYSSLTLPKLVCLMQLNHDGYRFWQYADFVYDLNHHGQLPGNGTDDGSLFYKTKPDQMYGGQGAPGIYTEQFEIDYIQTAHLRHVPPPGISLKEYAFARTWYHTWAPNEIMEHGYNQTTKKKFTKEEVLNYARNTSDDFLRSNYRGYKLGEINDKKAPKDIPEIIKVGIEEYILAGKSK